MRSTHPFRRTLCTTLSVLAMIGAMSACAGDPPDDPSSDEQTAGERSASGVDPSVLTDTVAATRSVSRARVELRITVDGPGSGAALVHRASYTDGGLRAEAASDMSEAVAALEAAGQRIEGDWSQPTSVIVDGDAVYSQIGPMAVSIGRAPDDWVRARISDVTAAGAENDALALALDPLGPLDLLYRPVAEVEQVAAGEDIRGVATRHLRATLDLTGVDGAPPASFEARLVAAGVEALPVEVWIDDDGVARRLVVTVDEAGPLTTTFDVYDVDAEDIAVTPPADADVVTPASPET